MEKKLYQMDEMDPYQVKVFLTNKQDEFSIDLDGIFFHISNKTMSDAFAKNCAGIMRDFLLQYSKKFGDLERRIDTRIKFKGNQVRTEIEK